MAFPEWKNAPFFEVDRVGYSQLRHVPRERRLQPGEFLVSPTGIMCFAREPVDAQLISFQAFRQLQFGRWARPYG